MTDFSLRSSLIMGRYAIARIYGANGMSSFLCDNASYKYSNLTFAFIGFEEAPIQFIISFTPVSLTFLAFIFAANFCFRSDFDFTCFRFLMSLFLPFIIFFRIVRSERKFYTFTSSHCLVDRDSEWWGEITFF